MARHLRLRVFISSPGDVPDERLRAELVIDKLQQKYARFFSLYSYRWEYEPMLASGHFQDIIDPPSKFDIVILVLWSRLGTPLPQKTTVREYRGMDGRTPVTGTEWEYEDALRSARDRGVPDLLVFRKVSPAPVDPLDAEARRRANAQMDALDAFWARHFQDKGVFLAAYTTYQDLEEFAARLEQVMSKLLVRRIEVLAANTDGASGPIWPGSPFRGLESYDFEHAAIFFGRDGLVAKAAEQLAARARTGKAFILVCGPSGSGKSSLVKAAVVPRLMKPQRIEGAAFLRRAVFRPGDRSNDLILSFVEALTEGPANDGIGLPELLAPGQSTAHLAGCLRSAPQSASYAFTGAIGRLTREARKAGRVLAHEQAKLIVVVDQLEEIFTQEGIPEDDRHLFTRLLAAMAGTGAVWLIATLRADFWYRASEIAELIALSEGQGRIDIPPTSHAELVEIIRMPAAAAGLSFETHAETRLGLDAMLAGHVASQPGVLPLLSFTLDALYREDVAKHERRVLTFATYETLGGLHGAISAHADKTVAGLDDSTRAALRRVLRSLATVSSGGDPMVAGRSAPLGNFPPGSSARMLIDALIAARLLVAAGGGETATVRLAHEALLTNWSRACAQIAGDHAELRIRARLEQATALWEEAASADKDSWLLAEGRPLAEATQLLESWDEDIDWNIRNYIQASVARVQEKKRKEQQRRKEIETLTEQVRSGFAVGWTASGRDAATASGKAMNDQSVQPSELLGAEISGFRLSSFIGSGGSGMVYRATSRDKSKEDICIKILYPFYSSREDLYLVGRRMTRALSSVDHPGVIRVFGCGRFAWHGWTTTALMMEYIDGPHLAAWCKTLRETPDSILPRLDVAARLADALVAAHGCRYFDDVGVEQFGICHGDIKPENIIMNSAGHPVLTDFMLADASRIVPADVSRIVPVIPSGAPQPESRLEKRRAQAWSRLATGHWRRGTAGLNGALISGFWDRLKDRLVRTGRTARDSRATTSAFGIGHQSPIIIRHRTGSLGGREREITVSSDCIVFGRDPRCDVVFPPDAKIVARRHFALQRNPSGKWTIDLFYDRPVTLDGKPADIGAVVESGAVIQLGDTEAPSFEVIIPMTEPYDPMATTEFFGTPGYMSIEQEEQGLVSRKSDIYSLGITYRVLFGGNVAEPLTSSPLSPYLPKPLIRLADRMTQQDPDRRPSGAVEVQRALHKLILWHRVSPRRFLSSVLSP